MIGGKMGFVLESRSRPFLSASSLIFLTSSLFTMALDARFSFSSFISSMTLRHPSSLSSREATAAASSSRSCSRSLCALSSPSCFSFY